MKFVSSLGTRLRCIVSILDIDGLSFVLADDLKTLAFLVMLSSMLKNIWRLGMPFELVFLDLR